MLLPKRGSSTNGACRRAKVAAALRCSNLDDKPLDVVLGSDMWLIAQLNVQHRAGAQELMPAALSSSLNNPVRDGGAARGLIRSEAQRRGCARGAMRG
jgi:hypothetical protein